MTLIDDPVLKDAAESSLSALLLDRDVQEIGSLEGGFLDVVRRGKRERLDAVLEGPLFALLREAGAEGGIVELRLRGAHRLLAGPLADGRIGMRVQKSPSADVSLELLTEEGLLPPGIGAELMAALLDGAGLAVIGPARVGRQRVVAAVSRALAPVCSLSALTDGVPLSSMPLNARAPLEHRAEAAQLLGGDVLVALELSARDAAAVARARPALPLLASVLSPSSEALAAALDAAGIPVGAVFGTVAVIGFGPDGRPRLSELHGPARAGGADVPETSPRPSAPVTSPATVASLPTPTSAGGAPRSFYESLGGDVVPPGSWRAESPDLDPGWELDDASMAAPSPGSFDAVLHAQKARPTFTPRPPREHPQAGKLKGDPFGGLTFEPPSDDDIAEGDDRAADASDEPDTEGGR